MSEPTVFIVDDDPSARRGITRLVRAAGMKAESFASAKDFLASNRAESPGCVLLDVKMPEMTGPELQEQLNNAKCNIPIIFLSAHGNVTTAAGAMKKGAVDFLTKPVDREELLEAIRISLAKDSENRAQWIEINSIHERLKNLSPREYDVMTYVITGMLNKQIAGEMDISEGTVKVHRGRVMKKLGIDSVAELVRLCDRARISSSKSNK